MLQYLPKQRQTERDQGTWSCEEQCKKQDQSHEQHRRVKRREYVFWSDEDKNTVKDKWSAFDGKQDDRADYQLDKSIVIITVIITVIIIIINKWEKEEKEEIPTGRYQASQKHKWHYH